MDFSTIGTVHMAAKNWKLQTQWGLKRSSGDLTGHTASLNEALKTSAQSDSDGDKTQTIMNKLYAGQKLTREEKAYLKEHNPKLYAMVEAADEDAKRYERELKRCRTKEEAQRLKTARVNASLTRIKAVENNAAIPEEKKEEAFAAEKYRYERIDAGTRAFVKGGGYGRLPTEAEKAKAEKEEREAEAVREGRKAEDRKEAENTEGPEKAEGAEETKSRRTSSTEDGQAKPESPTARKVKRAKARAAAYLASSGGAAEEDSGLSIGGKTSAGSLSIGRLPAGGVPAGSGPSAGTGGVSGTRDVSSVDTYA